MKPKTETDLYSLYLSCGWDDVYDFPTFMAKCELSGIIITKEESSDKTTDNRL